MVVLSDVESWPEWTASVTSVRSIGPGPCRSAPVSHIKQPRLPVTVSEPCSDLVEGERFAWTATGPGVNARASHRVIPAAEGSQATLSIDQAGILGRLVGLLYGRLTRRYVRMEAAGLKQRSEESAPQSRP